MPKYTGHNAEELNDLNLPDNPEDCTDAQLKAIWKLMDVPVEIDGEEGEEVFDTDFWIFPKGIEKFYVWHWFDEHFTDGLVKAINC